MFLTKADDASLAFRCLLGQERLPRRARLAGICAVLVQAAQNDHPSQYSCGDTCERK